MQPIQGYDQLTPRHGGFTQLKAGGYVMLIQRAREDVTGYGNPCLKVTYDIAEGPEAGRFADAAGDPEQDWRHEFEIDAAEANGARLKAFTDAVMASNPGYAWDWNEAGLVGRYVGIVLQERLATVKKGRNKGKDSRYLDFWDALPVEAIRAGQFSVPPVNDKRDPAAVAAREAQAAAPAQAAPRPAYAQAPQAAPTTPRPTQQAQAYGQPPQGMPVTQAGYQQPQTAPTAPVAPAPVAPAPVPPASPATPDLYDEDIPF